LQRKCPDLPTVSAEAAAEDAGQLEHTAGGGAEEQRRQHAPAQGQGASAQPSTACHSPKAPPFQLASHTRRGEQLHPNRPSASAPLRQSAPVKLAQCFLRLSNFDNGLFERIGRYETAVWRQVVQTLLTLQAVRRLR
jgi:hypothetical protein